MITDKIDGDLARKHNLVTNFGKIADPIADKAITGMAFIGLAIIADFMPAWLWWTVTIVVLIREWGVTIARLSIAKDVVMPAKQSGKVKTVMQVHRPGWLHRARSGCSPAPSRWPATSSGGSRLSRSPSPWC